MEREPTQEIIQGDCLEVMKGFADKSFDLVLTSPPYDNLREYKGYTFDFEQTAQQIFRVLKTGGVCVWVVGDTTKGFRESRTSFEQALFFDSIGLWLLDTMIFLKKDYPPAYPSLRRYANQFEYMFVLTKGRPKTFNALRIPKVGKTFGAKAYRNKDGSLTRKTLYDNGLLDKPASNVWQYQVGGNLTGHPAVFPIQLAKDHILSWSNEGDTILDPFMGSGTTLVAAKQLNRNAVGIEISPEYCEVARRRLEQDILL